MISFWSVVESAMWKASLRSKRIVPPVNNSELIGDNVENDIQHENKSDTIITYCPACQIRLTLEIPHPNAKSDHYQLISIPDSVAIHLETRTIFCTNCTNTIIIEPVEKRNNQNLFTVKIDCSKMSKGYEEWYDNY